MKHPAAALLIAQLEAFFASGASPEPRSHPWRGCTKQQCLTEPSLIQHWLERDTSSNVRPAGKRCRCLGERGGDSLVTGTAVARCQLSSASAGRRRDETAATQLPASPVCPQTGWFNPFPAIPLRRSHLLLILQGKKVCDVAQFVSESGI